MKKIYFDLIMIILMGGLILIFNHFDLLEEYAKFAMIPFMIFYFLGQYSERRLSNKS